MSVIPGYIYLSRTMNPISEERRVLGECNICAIKFNKEDRIPIFICKNNHNTCKKCFDVLKGQKAYCPFCKMPVNYGDIKVNNNIFLEVSSLAEKLKKEKDDILRKNKDAEQKILGLNLEKEQYKKKIQSLQIQQSGQKTKIDDLNNQIKKEQQRNESAEKERKQREQKQQSLKEGINGFFRSWFLPMVILIRQNYKKIISFFFGLFLLSQFLISFLFFARFLGLIVSVWREKITFAEFLYVWFWLFWGCFQLIGGLKMTMQKNKTIFQRRKYEQLFYYLGNAFIFLALLIHHRQISQKFFFIPMKIIDTFILLILSDSNLTENRQNKAKTE